MEQINLIATTPLTLPTFSLSDLLTLLGAFLLGMGVGKASKEG